MSRSVTSALILCLLSTPLWATTFIVPDDKELVEKSRAIVRGVILDSFARQSADGSIETVYNVRVQRVLKGGIDRTAVIQVVSPGGMLDGRWTRVASAAHFADDDEVLLFLVAHRGQWTPTDMTLGKFRFVTSTGGQSLLVRDAEDIVGFDREMRTHVERVRRESEFLRFIEETVRGREAKDNYFVPPSEVVAYPVNKPGRFDVAPNTEYDPSSYAVHFGSIPGRWPESRMTSALAQSFFKNSAQSASGPDDGGVGIITSALAAWTNDCASQANWSYAGTNALLKDGDDNVNTFVWNDPSGNILNSWTGTGVIATAYMAGDAYHTFNGEVDGWISFSDCDVVVQDGLTGDESFIPTAITHEIGHCTALRHSNTHHDGSGCQGTDECTGSAVMNSSVVSGYLYNLQPWDLNAIRDLYPGGTCCTAPAITSQPASTSIFTGQTAFLTVGATGTATLSYQWYAGASGNTTTPVGTGSTLTVSPASTTSYWVRVTNSCGTADSNAVTVTVNTNTPSVATQLYLITPCRIVDTRNANGPTGGPSLTAGGVRNLTVAGVCGIPTGAVALSLNLAVINPVSNGYMTLYPGPIGSARPLAATINYKSGRVLANNAIVRIGSDILNVFNSGPSAVHYVIDVNGYFQ